MSTCEVCGGPKEKRLKRFCSNECYNQARKPASRFCQTCGTPLEGYQKSFCSRQCRFPAEKDRFCESCGKKLLKRHKRFCSKLCYGTWLEENPEERNHFKPGTEPWNKGMEGYMAGSDHWNWKGGARRHSHGYIEIRSPDHPNANSRGYVFEHRLVMEEHLDRLLDEDEVVHHINGKKADNRIDNLMVMSRSEHQSMHTKEWWVYVKGLIEADNSQ